MIRTKRKKTKAIVLSQAPEIVLGRKFELWCAHFLNKSSRETYLNATKSALKAYDTTNYFTAGAIGHQNYKKLQNLKLTYLDMEGYSFGERMKISLAKAIQGEYSDWHKFMIQVGEFEEKPTTLVQNNNNFDLSGLGEAIKQSRIERGLPIT